MQVGSMYILNMDSDNLPMHTVTFEAANGYQETTAGTGSSFT